MPIETHPDLQPRPSCTFQHPNNFQCFALTVITLFWFFHQCKSVAKGCGSELESFRHAVGKEVMELEGKGFTFNPGSQWQRQKEQAEKKFCTCARGKSVLG